jgi:hypothetical protein
MSEQSDLPSQFPQLQSTGGNFHYTLSIDKSVSKIAGWVIGLLLGLSFIAAFALFMAYDARDKAIKTETEFQLVDDWMQQHGIRKGPDGRYQVIEVKPNE